MKDKYIKDTRIRTKEFYIARKISKGVYKVIFKSGEWHFPGADTGYPNLKIEWIFKSADGDYEYKFLTESEAFLEML